ncbi:hypothetical protein L2755_03555 [Shewanella abyssi]|uniref:hypothetical protein n=1 Tax=Shewanella abyssi TaxID=311789 RepID=UPI00201045C7|nr:hypothetical protein [Shewanella abyssi]MCL1048713.1 hypothetical protein [Shewanella abyssi]
MSVIEATRLQFKKSAFAEEISKQLVNERTNHDLFHVATTIETTSHIIAAIVGSEKPEQLVQTPMNDRAMFEVLFTCLRLLFVKQVQGNELSQGEQLIVTLANRYAIKLSTETSSSQLGSDIVLVKKLYKQLQALALKEARSQRSMC